MIVQRFVDWDFSTNLLISPSASDLLFKAILRLINYIVTQHLQQAPTVTF